MAKARVILLSVGAAVGYGVVHDQIRVRLCLESFSVAHPPLFRTGSPTLLALAWGVTATVWAGLVLGVLLARAAQAGDMPPVPFRRLATLVLALLATMAVAATVAGLAGYELSRRAIVSIPWSWAVTIPPSQHHRFMAVWFAHGASYLGGLGGGAFLIFRIWDQLRRPRILAVLPRDRLAVGRTALLLAALALAAWWRFRR